MRKALLVSLLMACVAGAPSFAEAEKPAPNAHPGIRMVGLRVEMLTPIVGTERWDWWQARTAQVPGAEPLWVTTMSGRGRRLESVPRPLIVWIGVA